MKWDKKYPLETITGSKKQCYKKHTKIRCSVSPKSLVVKKRIYLNTTYKANKRLQAAIYLQYHWTFMPQCNFLCKEQLSSTFI